MLRPGELPTHRLTEQVISRRRLLGAAESMWLALLVEFDKRCAWAADGAWGAVDWLVVHCGLGRSTAKEKLRVAYELDRRPLISEAFASGEISGWWPSGPRSRSRSRALMRGCGGGRSGGCATIAATTGSG